MILQTRRTPTDQSETYTCARAYVLTLKPECAFWHEHTRWVQHLPEITTPQLPTQKMSRKFLLTLSLKHAITANPIGILVHVRPRLHPKKQRRDQRVPRPRRRRQSCTETPVTRQRPQAWRLRAAMALEMTTAFEIQIQAQEPLGKRGASPLSWQWSRKEDGESFVIVLQTYQVTCPTACARHELRRYVLDLKNLPNRPCGNTKRKLQLTEV